MPQSRTIYQTRVTWRQDDNLSKAANSLFPKIERHWILHNIVQGRVFIFSPPFRKLSSLSLSSSVYVLLKHMPIILRTIYQHKLFGPMRKSIWPVGKVCLSICTFGRLGCLGFKNNVIHHKIIFIMWPSKVIHVINSLLSSPPHTQLLWEIWTSMSLKGKWDHLTSFRQILSISDIDHWPQGHIGNLNSVHCAKYFNI